MLATRPGSGRPINRALTFALAMALTSPGALASQVLTPDTVQFKSGELTLRGLVWRPAGNGPFPAVLFNHGSGRATYEREMKAIGPFYASQGYVLFWPYRRGQGLSQGRGQYIVDILDSVNAKDGPAMESRAMAGLLGTEQVGDALAALEFLKQMKDVDSTRIAVAGNSFGGIVTVFLAERAPGIRAAIASAPAAQTWASSPDIREALIKSARNAQVPIYFMQAANDYDLSPSGVLSHEMSDAGKAYRVKIYPAYGSSTAEGHSFGYFAVDIWSPDVLEFLSEQLRPARGR